MKAWVVRFASLYLFNVVVLLVIGAIFGSVRVGWAALWASLLLTAGTIWLKPLLRRLFRGMAARSASRRSRMAEKLVQALIVFVIELGLWIVVVVFSSVDVRGWLLGWILPPIALLIAFAIYDLVDDRIEARAGALYDRVGRRGATAATTDTAAAGIPPVPRPAGAAPAASPPPAARAKDPYDGLTAEQRRMLDDLG
ncbi:hypothetical protein AB0N73_07255 [Microbacterium sp. NPDC089189]|uniref:hypothetical protein n=1 Tax=Microbacterium sp. NPDC089189 TaxID=3154972 RepID=UPI003434F036